MPACFSQRNPAWAHERLGLSALTLDQAGCLVAALASVLADWSVPTDPGRLNAWLRTADGFACGNRVRLGAVRPLGARLALVDDCYRHRAPRGWLRRALGQGLAVVALIDTRPGRVSRAHWVRLLSIAGRECVLMDPWQAPGAEVVDLRRTYGEPAWDVGRAVFVYAAYARASVGGCGEEWTGDPEQGVVCVRR